MPATPILSIIVPVYNSSEKLNRCFESLAAQSLKEIEVILIDDCSSDTRTREILTEWAAKDERFRTVFKEVNEGQGTARNLGVAMARGEHLCFVDADDWVTADMCEKLLGAAQASNADLVYAQLTFIQNGKASPCLRSIFRVAQKLNQATENVEKLPELLFCHNYPVAKLYKKSLITENGVSFTGVRMSEDVAFSAELFILADRIAAIETSVYYYELSNPGSTNTIQTRRKFEYFQSLDELEAMLRKYEVWEKYEKAFCHYVQNSGCGFHYKHTPQPMKKEFYTRLRERIVKMPKEMLNRQGKRILRLSAAAFQRHELLKRLRKALFSFSIKKNRKYLRLFGVRLIGDARR